MVKSFTRIASRILVCSLAASVFIGVANADEVDNQSDPKIENQFSAMASSTYDGYPLFPQGVEGSKFHYSSAGIDVKGYYNQWTGILTYTVTEGGNLVTRSDRLSHSGYRMIHGINYSQNLFVVSYRR